MADAVLQFKVKADGSQAVGEMDKVRKAAKDLERATKFDAGQIAKGTSYTDKLIADNMAAIRSLERVSSGAGAAITNTTSKVAAAQAEAASFASRLSSFASVAVPALVTLGAGAASAGTAIFELTKRASDAGSKIHDFAQSTNLSTEFLSVLQVQAEQSGSSLDAAAPKAVKFGTSLVEAATGNKELIDSLKRFGIDATDAYRNPEQALKTFIENFNKLPPSAANNAAAMKLFKDRSGELLPVLRAFGTDYDGLVRKLDASGQIWTKEGADKADEFGDALTELGETAHGIANTFARELMPDITAAMKDITKEVTKNKDAFHEWGRSVGDVVRGVRVLLDGHGSTILNWLSSIALAFAPILAGAKVLQQIGASSRGTIEPGAGDPGRRFGGMANAPDGGQPYVASTAAPDDVTNEAAAKKAAAMLSKARAQDITASATAAETAYKAAVDAAEKAFTESNDLLDLIGSLKKAETDRWAARKKQFDDERAEIRKKDQEAALTAAELRVKNEEEKMAQAAHLIKMGELDEQFTAKHLGELQKRHTRELELFDLNAQEYNEHQKALAQAGEISYAEAQKRITAEQASGFNKRRELLEAEKDAAQGNAEKVADLIHQLAVLEQQAALFRQEATGAAASATADDLDRLIKKVDEALNRIDRMRQMGGELGVEAPVPPGVTVPTGKTPEYGPGSAPYVDPGKFIAEHGAPPNFDPIKSAIEDLKTTALDSFNAMAEGMGSMVAQWVMYGDLGQGGIRKLIGSVLASFAQMTAVQALMELAYAAAGLTHWGRILYGAPGPHLKAAALLGAAAAASAVAGRAVAGNSGKGSAYGSGGGGGDSFQPNNQTFNYSGNAVAPSSAELARGGPGIGSALAGALNGFNAQMARLQAMPAGHVVTMGAPDAHAAIGVAVITESNRNDHFNDTFARNMRVA